MKHIKIIAGLTVLVLIFALHYAFIGYKTAALLKSRPPLEKSEPVNVSDEERNEFIKNNEDLVNVDYKVFYEDLRPYGTWIEVSLSDKSETSGISEEEDKISDIIRKILGIKNAAADVNINWNIIYVWKPAPNMAAGIIAGEPISLYAPYTNGRWVYTDYGWYFRAAAPYEEITHHYGRWVFVSHYGWIWIPGNTWAPAWVNWQDDDDYIAWTPYSAGIYYAAAYFGAPYIFEPKYVVCERRHFLEPNVFRYSVSYSENDRGFRFRERFTGKNILGSAYMHSSGPNPVRFSSGFGKRNSVVKINLVSRKSMVKYGNKKFSVYAPLMNIRNDNNTKSASLGNEKNGINLYSTGSKNKFIPEIGKQVYKDNEGKPKKENNIINDRKGVNKNDIRKNESRIKTRGQIESPENIKGKNTGNRKNNDKGNRLSGKDKKNGFPPGLSSEQNRKKNRKVSVERKSKPEGSNVNKQDLFRTGGRDKQKSSRNKH